MPIESETIKIVNRSTYEERKQSGDIDGSTIYFVVEDTGEDAENCLTLYVGMDKQTDIIEIQDILASNDSKIRDKIYYKWNEDTESYSLYMVNSLSNSAQLYPIQANILWGTLDD